MCEHSSFSGIPAPTRRGAFALAVVALLLVAGALSFLTTTALGALTLLPVVGLLLTAGVRARPERPLLISSVGDPSGCLEIGPYVCEEKIGEGGMGTIYRARHGNNDRPVALKLLLPNSGVPNARKRFGREVRITRQLRHRNTVQVLDHGETADGRLYYVMELIDGLTLKELVTEHGPQPEGRVTHILRQVSSVLQAAHAAHVMHCDLKPANVLLRPRGTDFDEVKVLDFGLVSRVRRSWPSFMHRFRAKHLAGSPHYLAPENLHNGRRVDERSDLYSLGAIAWFLLTGREVFEAETVAEVCRLHLTATPMLPSEDSDALISEPMRKLLFQCLEKDPDHRPQSVDDFVRTLDECDVQNGWSPECARRWWEPRLERIRRMHCATVSHRTRKIEPEWRTSPPASLPIKSLATELVAGEP